MIFDISELLFDEKRDTKEKQQGGIQTDVESK